MRYQPVSSELFIENRKNLKKQLSKSSVAVVNANDILPTNADGTLSFIQSSDLFYLTGIDQEETILIIAPDHPIENYREILFIKKTSPLIAVWEGHKYTTDEAFKTSGIKNIQWLDNFDAILYDVVINSNTIYLNTNEHLRAVNIVQSREDRFIQNIKKKFPLHQLGRLAPILNRLRSIKSNLEISLLQQACNITKEGFLRILKFVKPEVFEYEIEAEFIHEFTRRKSDGFGYLPIIASGLNACVLHYIDNNQPCKAGDLLLLDVGAKYANYNADLSRTIPVSGKYSKRQREVYDAVLRVKNQALNLIYPGQSIQKYHAEVGEIATEELIKLNLLTKDEVKHQTKEAPVYKKYLMHGISHHLGLDVHDVPNMYDTMKVGNVFTVEPGFYIPEEKIGIRLEDDIYVSEAGNVNLMKNIPIFADEIENLMN